MKIKTSDDGKKKYQSFEIGVKLSSEIGNYIGYYLVDITSYGSDSNVAIENMKKLLENLLDELKEARNEIDNI